MKNLLLKLNEKKCISLITLLLVINFGYTQTSQTFTTPGLGSVVIPAGVTTITVEAWGAGGGGGSSNNTNSNGGSGGGGGAYARGIHTVTPGSTYYYTVGTKGTGGPANSTVVPTAGTVSWFKAIASSMTPPTNFGNGALANGGGAGVNNSNTSPNNGGTAFGNNAFITGATGAAGSNSGGGNGGTAAGVGGGTGGNGSNSSDGSNGNPPGGGGGGSDDAASRKGGDGGHGQVRITWTCPTYSLTSATTATGPFCGTSTSDVTLSSTSIPTGTYTVTYNLSGATSATGVTATMNFTVGTPGTGTFTTPILNIGTTNITITNLASGTVCSNSVSSNNTASVIINTSNSISLTSAIGTDNQTRCVGSAITTITYNTAGATGATISGLPAGVSGSWAGNVVTISGTPSLIGTYNYTITLTGGCGTSTATGTIIVSTSNTIASGINRTACINNAISTINLATTGATGATFSGLPTGISGSWAANMATISGTPTVAGTFNYTVTTLGGCAPVTATGTITVTPLNTIAAGINRTTCINTAVTSITLATTGATGATVTGLPAGVTGTWATNQVTISGTPTASGTFNYTVTTTGGCPPATTTGTITVNPLNTIAAGSNITTCINSAITSITLATTGATGATFTGLPAGVTGSWAANMATISGTPTASGTFNYTVTTTGGCLPATTTGTITVTPLNTIAAGVNRTTCVNTAITSITLATTGATGATFTGLPAGVTGSWAANVATISGTPTASGTFNYTVTTTGGCGTITTGGTITVTNNTITLASAAGTDNQTRCISTVITQIRYNTTGATGATVTGLPAGVNGSWAANQVNIIGTPTVSGIFNYTVTTTGGCAPVTATGTITVNPLNTIAAGSNRTNCVNTAITSITLATTGATSVTFTGLPAGVTGSWSANVATISGTPTASGTFNYTVTTTGGCLPATTTGTITVTPLNNIAAGVNRTTCNNSSITNITLATTGATGATITGLPAGVTGNWAANLVTISGTPTASGSFPYTVTLTGGCGTVTTSGTITVTPNNTITLASAAGTDNQTMCISTAITQIRYNTTGATGATFSGLPAGVTGSWASNVATISGTPTVSGIFNYTVTTTGGCPLTTVTGTITVNANNSITLTSAVGTNNQNICINTPITNITYTTVSATGATFSGLPAGVTGNWAANAVTISGAPTGLGTFNYTVTLTGGCGPLTTATGTFTVTPVPTITGTTPGSRTGAGTVNLGATASAGTINWYAAATGGASLGTGTSFTTPVISTTTTFYVDATNNGCTTGTRTAVVATVNYGEIDVLGNATSIVSGDITPSLTDWTDFGSTNISRTFTIRNTGSALLTIGTISISGTNASEFSVTSAPSAIVAVGSSTTFTVTFAPTAVGVRTATITLSNNDTDENPFTFDIQGTGVEQEIDIQGNAISILDGDTTPSTADWTDFSNVAGTRTFTIRNLGNIALSIGAITITGTNAGDFTITTPPSATIAAYGTTTFTVTFSPSAINSRTATINIVNNDNTENPYNFAIQGFGIIPEIDVQGNATSIVDGDVTPSLSDWTDFGSTSATRTYTIFNFGNIALTVGTITITGANASEFTVTTFPSATVAAFSSTTFVVTFTPTTTGVRTATINIDNNDSNENPYNFNIQGTGTPREIDVEGLSLSISNGDAVPSVSDGTDFGPADINLATVTRTFSIRNTGSLALTISNPTITGLNASEFSISANPSTLVIGAGDSTTFSVTFNPSGVFTRVAQINIVNNDSDENPYTFVIQGTGLLDNDGDGVENNLDQDDDNDGIIDTIECGTCISDPFVNGGFETPVIAPTSYSIAPDANVPGWTNSAEAFIEIWSTGFNGVPAAAGNQFAELNANVAGTLYQSFCLNGAGGTINWAIKHRGRSGTDRADVRFGETLALAQSSSPVAIMIDGNTSWGSYSGTYNIPVGQTSIVLAFVAVSSVGGLSYGNFIDDVQIIINQNCIDSDGDGIADLLDVDDENDGISDVEEAGFKAYSNGLSTMDRSAAVTWVDANTNGLNDYIDAMISGGTYSLPDTDGDGTPNYLDLDSDNDTLFDVDEAGLFNGDGDITGDGKGDGLDTEGDGLLNLYDNSSTFGTTTRAYAQDSDGNGTPDYLQLDSNDDGINDIQTGLYASFDVNNDGIIDGTGDTDRDGILNVFDTNDVVKGSPRDIDRKLFLDFDGRNDYAEDSSILGGLTNASLMAWIDLNSAYNGIGVVVGQNRFHIRVTGSKILQAVANGTILSFGTPLNTAQWYHVAATYANGNLTLYLNGKVVASQALTAGPINADASRLTLGKNAVSNTQYFRGKIDEVRVFNVALTTDQVQRMVYQEIQNTASQVRGAIVPKDIGSLPFANVLKYYRMDTYKDDIVDDLTTPSIDTGTGMKLYNHKVINVQQAPMPFTTVRAGSFATAVNDVTKDIRGMDVIDYDASIIQVKHNITETANNTDLAMFVDAGVTVNMTNDTKIQNDWYLELDGKIDLVGKSQLVQTANSDLDVTSAGFIERDQEGDPNRFNYNYWSSPVSSINNTSINHGFTVNGVMKDGTTTTPQNITWTSGINGAPTSPITLSSYWIFKFQNLNNSYANWASVGQNGTLLAGQGFTMKGSGAATPNQNYTFVGKPNNGTITSPVSANNLNLCGNPYASAIDADQFIDDNAASIKGTLFFWEHFDTNTSHNTVEYQGGYATYTKVGGTAPVAPVGISGLGASSKTPKRFIPVGQGFFVTGTPTGGTITFNNGQRLFVKEDNSSSYTLFRNSNPTVSSTAANNNANDSFVTEEFMKLRLGYTSTNNYHRQILLGFMDQNATAGYDEGYDGLSIETLTNDMYFMQGTNKLNIQGDGYFNVNNVYPLGVKNATAGNVKFGIDNKENFNDDQEIYIYDNQNNQYHSIKSQDFEINLPAGVTENRFSLRFTTSTSLGTNDNEIQNEIGIIHSQSDNIITIKNELLSVEIKSVMLFNLVGQRITTWDIENPTQTKIELPVINVSTGAYIVKVITDKGDVTKKILVK
ncbi:choice-of-anchor D domain-containing protein [Flavobacterium sp. RSB2_4_14]|uniref:choice-of-anchor D domain-containing protein n=1 Tax=Flavobacterium sp. RSB2_4_14 TaxID=3447665 RepID=UPI003F3924F5